VLHSTWTHGRTGERAEERRSTSLRAQQAAPPCLAPWAFVCALCNGRRALLCRRPAPCPPPVGRLLLLLLHHCVGGSVSTSFAHPSPLGCDRHLPAVSGLGPLNARQTARRRCITLDCTPTTTPALPSAPALPIVAARTHAIVVAETPHAAAPACALPLVEFTTCTHKRLAWLHGLADSDV
jgi:hypothetical protein